MRSLTTLYKRTRLFTRLVYHQITKTRAPVIAYLLVTNRCQMNCRYCFVDHVALPEEMSTEKIISLIDELYDKGTRMICLMGGEPLLKPGIDKIVDHIVHKGIICDMTTNGLLVKNKLDVVKKLDAMMISLDGDESANDLNRGKGTYPKIVEGIRVARENGVIVRLNCVLTRKNMHSIGYMLKFAKNNGLFVTFALMAEPYQTPADLKEFTMSDAEIKQTYVRLKQLRAEGWPVLFSNHTLDYVINYPLAYNQLILKNAASKILDYYRHECRYGRTMAYIESDGKTYPCAALWNVDFFKPKSAQGKGGFQAAWDNLDNLPCKTCFQPGCSEWNYLTTVAGVLHGVTFTLRQFFSRNQLGFNTPIEDTKPTQQTLPPQVPPSASEEWQPIYFREGYSSQVHGVQSAGAVEARPVVKV